MDTQTREEKIRHTICGMCICVQLETAVEMSKLIFRCKICHKPWAFMATDPPRLKVCETCNEIRQYVNSEGEEVTPNLDGDKATEVFDLYHCARCDETTRVQRLYILPYP